MPSLYKFKPWIKVLEIFLQNLLIYIKSLIYIEFAELETFG